MKSEKDSSKAISYQFKNKFLTKTQDI